MQQAARHEKPLVWGVAGPAGAQGPPGLSVDQDSLLALLEAQDSKIETLTTQIDALNNHVVAVTEMLGRVCGEVSTMTTQLNAIRGVVAGLGLNNFLTSVGGALQIPALPAALNPFACSGP